ncbi:glycosyltransferase family 4 protein [Arcobacter roscoffensis]|uniref:Undecaprenyl/decaprenyl-phosphate alpha-N-acetylglucosaminyl 1-phosphate transferase n=1 Tax=Arcobacter roscoffensis TaxID=2961520 RepID=A0ABY5E3P3_9BACT|nr:MraY family glycosyltransferase [Arcobacter roscoffensis]UTJ05785.1 undecaprenyl/decaprenyl-phosphate alpha-N-acetylglucosaminyl 1-phosphate transferase [Arcobacter roscoffensis]
MYELPLLGFFLIIFTYMSIRKFINLAPKLKLIDIPNQRSSHKSVTPRGAGIVFGTTFLISLFLYYQGEITPHLLIILSILIVFIGGVVDDIYTLSSKTKLAFIVLAAIIAYFDGYTISSIGTYFGYELNLGIIALPFTLFAIIAFTNAVNLTDGLDGLASSISIIILAALLTIGILNNDTMLTVWPALLICSVLGFLILNWYPAKVFMGDSGSLLLGFIIAILSIKALEYVNPVAIFFLAAVPILDTLVVFRRRRQRGKSPFEADKNHLHHILDNIKQNKAFTVKMLIFMQLTFSCMFLQLYKQDDGLNLLIFFLLFLIFFDLFDPRARKRPKNAKLKKKYKRLKKEKKENQKLEKKLENIS